MKDLQNQHVLAFHPSMCEHSLFPNVKTIIFYAKTSPSKPKGSLLHPCCGAVSAEKQVVPQVEGTPGSGH
jgi:hypothetical protein